MEVQGKIKVIGEVQTFGSGDTPFKKRDIVLTTDEQYPQYINIELHQDKCDLINPFNLGDDIKISINLRGKLWTSPQGVEKYFNTLVGWRIEKVLDAPNIPQPPLDKMPVNEEEPLDLPF